MKLKKLFIIIVLLFATSGLSYYKWGDYFPSSIDKLIFLAIPILILLAKKRTIGRSAVPKFALLFATLPFVSMIGAHIYHGQSWRDCVTSTLPSLTYLIFFLLLYWKVKERDVIQILVMFGLAFSLIELIQEVTYPHIYFFDSQGKGGAIELEIRNGLYRFRMAGIDFAVLLLFFSFQSLSKRINAKYIVLLLIGAIGVYLSLTRQIIAASFGSAILVLILSGKKNILRNLIVVGVVGWILYANMDVLFGSFVEQTDNDLGSDYIRFLSYNYFGIEWNHGDIVRCLIGNGMPYYNVSSPYGREIDNLHNVGLFASDVGIVGVYAIYGFIFAACTICFIIYAFRNFKYLEPYSRMFLLYSTITYIMLWSFGGGFWGNVRTGIFMYLMYLNIEKNKKTNRTIITVK